MAVMEKAPRVEEVRLAPSVHKGPVEGLLIVNGRPQIERADMPTISFESIQAIINATKKDN